MKSFKRIFYLAGVPLILSVSCQKVIDIGVFNSAPQLVAEGTITDQQGPCIVKLTKTIDIDNFAGIPSVTGADVEISDSAGVKETLTEAGNGIYISNTILGIPGHKYKLMINSGGQLYSAVSVMPHPVTDFRLGIKKEVAGTSGGSPGTGGEPYQYRVSYAITDPGEYENYYRLVIFHNNMEISSRRVFDDKFHNGKVIEDDFVLHDTLNFRPGDLIEIDLQNIDRDIYNFFRTLRMATGGLSFLSASPANPLSNITNGGLGYFSACSVIKKHLTIPG